MKEGEDFPSLSGHSSVFIKNNIVLFGGIDSNGKNNNVLNVFNLQTNAWSQKQLKGMESQIPKPRVLHTANVSKGPNIQTDSEIEEEIKSVIIILRISFIFLGFT